MKIKDILGKAYNALEFVVVIATMIYIVAMRFGDVTHDRIEYLDRWEYAIIGLAWLFFIGLPIILIYLISLVRAIPLRNTRQKTMMALHVLNVGLWGIFYLALPKSEPCTAAQMEAHYLSHHDEIHDLIAYTKSCLDDSTTIDYQAGFGGRKLIASIVSLFFSNINPGRLLKLVYLISIVGCLLFSYCCNLFIKKLKHRNREANIASVYLTTLYLACPASILFLLKFPNFGRMGFLGPALSSFLTFLPTLGGSYP